MLQSCFSRSCWLWSAASGVGSKMTGTREGVTESAEMIDFMVVKNHAGVSDSEFDNNPGRKIVVRMLILGDGKSQLVVRC